MRDVWTQQPLLFAFRYATDYGGEVRDLAFIICCAFRAVPYFHLISVQVIHSCDYTRLYPPGFVFPTTNTNTNTTNTCKG